VRLSKKPSVQDGSKTARCSAVWCGLTAPAEANEPEYAGAALRAAMLRSAVAPMSPVIRM